MRLNFGQNAYMRAMCVRPKIKCANVRACEAKNRRNSQLIYIITNIAYMFWNKTICKHIQARGMLRYYNKKNTDKAKSCLGLKLRNFTIESIQTKAKLCSKYMCQFEAYKSRMLSTSNQGSSDLTRQIVGRRWNCLNFRTSYLLEINKNATWWNKVMLYKSCGEPSDVWTGTEFTPAKISVQWW